MKIIDIHGNWRLIAYDNGSYLITCTDKSQMSILTRDYELAILYFLEQKKTACVGAQTIQ